jgi:Icc-related predicted phosphoesterase
MHTWPARLICKLNKSKKESLRFLFGPKLKHNPKNIQIVNFFNPIFYTEARMKILHISDWHGDFSLVPQIKELTYDIVVMSGDMIKNSSRVKTENEISQPKWLELNKGKFEEIVGSRPFLFCEGNHDFVDPTPIIGGINISYKQVEVMGYKFYGFPAIPFIKGEWNHETLPKQMGELSHEVLACDILVCHCPLAGLLDVAGYGNGFLANRFNYELDWPKAILCGHYHETHGITKIDDCIVSNAATTYHIVDV